jgi:hypothetical protein
VQGIKKFLVDENGFNHERVTKVRPATEAVEAVLHYDDGGLPSSFLIRFRRSRSWEFFKLYAMDSCWERCHFFPPG